MAAKRSTKRSATKRTAARGAKKAVAKKAKVGKVAAKKKIAAKPAKLRSKAAAKPAAKKAATKPAAKKVAAKPAAKPTAKPPAAPKPAAAEIKSRLVWADLMTSDLGAAQSFYKSLLGWGTKDADVPPPMNKYTMFNWNNSEFGGVAPKPAPEAPNMWLGYIWVADVDQTTKRAEGLGGKVLMGPMDIPNVGRFSVIADPTGAAVAPISFLQPPQPQQAQGILGPVAWFELHTTDTAKAGAFYKELFGWGASEMDMGGTKYTVFKSGDRDAGGMGDKMPIFPSSTWILYFAVNDVDERTKAAEAAGGKVLAPAMDIPKIGRMSWVTDPQGAAFALFKPSPEM